MTVQDVITGALSDLGIIQAGETPANADTEIAFSRLNDWIDGNKLLAGLIFTTERTTWALGSAAYYTVGPQATLNMARPTSPEDIDGVAFYDTTITPILELATALFTDGQYQAIPQKTLTSTYPVGFYYSPTFGVSGWGTLTPWPIPTSTTLRGVIYARAPVDEFDATTDTVYLPPGYRRFFRTNLAMEVAAAFGVPVPPQIERIARSSKHDVETANLRMVDLSVDPLLTVALYNIYSDTNS